MTLYYYVMIILIVFSRQLLVICIITMITEYVFLKTFEMTFYKNVSKKYGYIYYII